MLPTLVSPTDVASLNALTSGMPVLFGVDLLQVVFFVFIIASSLIGQAIKAAQERAKDQRRQREIEERAEREMKRRGPQAAPGPPRSRPLPPDMARELEQLLGRVTGQQATPAAERPARPAEVVRSTRETSPRPPRRETGEAESDARQGATVAEHVQQHLRPGEVARNTNRLGRELSQADERMETHLQNTFEHRVGQFGGLQARVEQGTDAAYWSGTQDAESPVIARVHEMLDSPQDIRAVFLLGEILRRPDFD